MMMNLWDRILGWIGQHLKRDLGGSRSIYRRVLIGEKTDQPTRSKGKAYKEQSNKHQGKRVRD